MNKEPSQEQKIPLSEEIMQGDTDKISNSEPPEIEPYESEPPESATTVDYYVKEHGNQIVLFLNGEEVSSIHVFLNKSGGLDVILSDKHDDTIPDGDRVILQHTPTLDKTFRESTSYKRALRELTIPLPDWETKGDIDNMMFENIMELIYVFSTQGHSGFSANYASGILNKLLRHEILTPLNGTDDEWIEVANDPEPVYQNNRASNVFRDSSGTYQYDYFVFEDENGDGYTNKESRKYIESFPYVPKRVYVPWGSTKEAEEKSRQD